MKRIVSIFLLLLLLLTGCQKEGGSTAGSDAACAHVDVDDNGLCDECAGSVIAVVD